MINFFDWMKESPAGDRTWLVLGKGPSFERISKYPDVDQKFATIGLNHACRQKHMLVAHMIDADVLDEVPKFNEKTDYILMPWQPHFNSWAREKTLEQFSKEHKVLRDFEARGRLLWYNASTGNNPRKEYPVVKVNFFSSEAVIRMLAMAGVKTIRTLGIDGGKTYASSFKDIKPFRGGHNTFDHQNKPIQDTVKEFGLDFSQLP